MTDGLIKFVSDHATLMLAAVCLLTSWLILTATRRSNLSISIAGFGIEMKIYRSSEKETRANDRPLS